MISTNLINATSLVGLASNAPQSDEAGSFAALFAAQVPASLLKDLDIAVSKEAASTPPSGVTAQNVGPEVIVPEDGPLPPTPAMPAALAAVFAAAPLHVAIESEHPEPTAPEVLVPAADRDEKQSSRDPVRELALGQFLRSAAPSLRQIGRAIGRQVPSPDTKGETEEPAKERRGDPNVPETTTDRLWALLRALETAASATTEGAAKGGQRPAAAVSLQMSKASSQEVEPAGAQSQGQTRHAEAEQAFGPAKVAMFDNSSSAAQPMVDLRAIPHVFEARIKPEAAAIARTDVGSDLDNLQIDHLLRDISEITSAAGKASFQLATENLGRLHVKLENTDAGVFVAVRTDNERGHVAVTQAQKQLHDEMNANGLKVSDTSVSLGHSGTERDRSDRAPPLRLSPMIEAKGELSIPHNEQTKRPQGRFA